MPPKFSTAHKRLLRELKEITKNPIDGIIASPLNDNDLFHWRCIITGPNDTPYEFGIFEAILNFPSDYPLSPPTMKFLTPIFHPNIYKDGKVCISILHSPGNDPLNYESADERWGPLQSIEKILLSVSSMIADPNPNSPANIDAAVLWRNNKDKYNETVKKLVIDSLSL
ncbi:E2 ubiquitin-conjugating protein [Pichia kluyveri]|uniref:E2 ubiquitin-conjugating enzyme n=1 Tax=Pichia kluyveri TaxID=36015 RepID=A0AAV5R020_PICKL|nr:E2 ubiquitin-conjugating protein [Pichia kluyveri]